MLHEVVRTNWDYINVLFVDQSTDLLWVWPKFELDDINIFVSEIIFNDHTKKHEVAEVLKGCMQIISEAKITEVVFNEFKDEVLSKVFKKSKDNLKWVNCLRIENTKDLKLETLQELQDNNIVS